MTPAASDLLAACRLSRARFAGRADLQRRADAAGPLSRLWRAPFPGAPMQDTEADLYGTTRVLVREPCTCGAARWFNCTCAEEVAEYAVRTFDTVPDAQQLAAIRAQHPGKTLIY